MRYHVFGQEKQTYKVCLLIPEIRVDDIVKAYLTDSGLNQEDIVVISLHQAAGKKKTPMSEIKAYIEQELVPVWKDLGVEYLLVADSDYFKGLTKAAKTEAHLGYVMPCAFGPQKVVYVPNHKAIFYDPDKVRAKIKLGIDALVSEINGAYIKPGSGIITTQAYPTTIEDIERWLVHFIDNNIQLTADIEAYSLKHNTAGIGTISLSWNQHEGIAFAVDYGRSAREAADIRSMLREFFIQHKAGITWHNIAYDVYVLVYQLFMSDILDTEGMLVGLDAMLDNWDCTKLIAYLATNSCAGNKLGLKDLSQEFAGNYAVEEIEDITKIPLPQLLEYNLIDGLSTWYVKNKYYPMLLADDQYDIYTSLFKKATKDIIQMQLTGLPVNMKRVKEVKEIFLADERKALDTIENSKIIQAYTYRLNEKMQAKCHAKWVKKRLDISEFNEKFNPNSGDQLRDLLFEVLGLPILGYTKNKQASTDGDTLEALRNHTQDKDIIDFLDAMIAYNTVNKLLTSFIPALEGSALGPDGWHYLFGNFNLGGTISGRLSSSKPNLQNLPSGGEGEKTLKGRYGKYIKSCFSAPPGWLFVGLDFNSLEDRISALTTKDPNKLKVYTDGYDGHCLRAYAYFGDKMPDIDPTSVVSINSIAKKYKPERQESKVPTFALTYMGTHITLMKNCGFSLEKAKLIETRYHELYKASDDWVAAKLKVASQVGYVTVAFGLRVRTPLLKQVIRGTSKTPYEAEAEGRSAGNAMGQSYCMLNSRAWIAFMEKVRASKYRLDIRPCAQIHDAGYALIRDDIAVVKYVNDNLVQEAQWQELPEIAHDKVKLGGELSIFYPDWNGDIVIPNYASEADILSIIDAELAKAA